MATTVIQKAGFPILFCGAMLAGWVCKPCLPHPTTPAATTPAQPIRATNSTPADDLSQRVQIAEDLTTADTASLARMADHFLQQESTDTRIWCAIFSCWMQVDPTAGWRFANRHRITAMHANLPLIALQQWASVDPTAARQILAAPDAAQTTALVRGMLDHDVEDAFKLLNESWAVGIKLNQDVFATTDVAADYRLMQLAAIDPQQAILWSQRFNDPDLLGSVVVGWMTSAADDARQWLFTRTDAADILTVSATFISNHPTCYRPQVMDALMAHVPPGNHKLKTIIHVMESLAEEDPEMAIKECVRLLDETTRPEAFAAIARSPHCDFEKAWNLLKTDGINPPHIARIALPAIENLTNDEAIEIGHLNSYVWGLTSMQDLAFPEQVKAELIDRMIEIDKQRAIKLLDNCTIAETTALGSNNAFDQWLANDPEEATRWLANKLGDQGDPEQVLTCINNLELNNEAWLTWAHQLPPGTVSTALEVMAYQSDLTSDPQPALRAARQSTAAAFWLEQVIATLAKRQPTTALQQLTGDAHATADIWNLVIATTMPSCPNESLTIIDALPDGEIRDAAIDAVINHYLSDPITATKWALVIGNQAKRHSAMEMIFSHASLDLRVIGNRQTAATLRALVNDNEDLAEEEQSHWIERINREFTTP